MSDQNTQPPSPKEQFLSNSPIGQHLLRLRKSWGWFVVFGLLLTICGAFAAVYIIVGTVVAIFVLGSLLFATGVINIISALQVRGIKSLFWFWLLSGILLILTGLVSFAAPAEMAVTLTVLFAMVLSVAGVLRVVSGFQSRGMDGWGWLVASGVLAVLAAFLIAMTLDRSSLVLPGFFLACELLFEGLMMLMFGFSLRKALNR